MQRRRFLVTAGSAAAAGVSGCLGLTEGKRNYDVGMRAVAFDPSEVTVRVGEKVVWYNNSSRAHSVTAYETGIPDGAEYFASGGFDAERAARKAWREGDGTITSGQSYTHTFETPGDYHYFCIPHEQGGMTGVVHVREK